MTHRAIPAQTQIIPIQVSREMSLPSARYSPSTVKRKASELVIGTVKESSKQVSEHHIHRDYMMVLVQHGNGRRGRRLHTGLANKQKEPDATRKIGDQGDGIAWLLDEADNGEERFCYLSSHPAARWVGYGRMCWCSVVDCGASNERSGETPANANEQERQHIIERRRCRSWHVRPILNWRRHVEVQE